MMTSLVAHAPARTRLVLILGVLSALGAIATDMYLSSFPRIGAHYGATPAQMQQTLSVFFLGLALGQFFYGPLIDRFGRRPPLIAGVLLFTASSVGLIFAPTMGAFIGLRLGQAVGCCAGMIIGRAIVRDLFDEQQSARVLSTMMSIQVVGPIVAPILGSLILALASWQMIFVVTALSGAACAAATIFGLPESLPVAARRRLSIHEIASAYIGLLGQRSFIVPTLSGTTVIASLYAYISASPFVFMQVYGASPQLYGVLFALIACGMVLFAQINRALLRHFTPRTVLVWAMGLNLAASLVLLLVARTPSLAVYMVPLWFSMATRAAIGANSTAVAMAATGRNAGTGSAIIGIVQFTLGGLAASLVGLLDDGTGWPLALVIFLANLLGGLIFLAVPKPDAAPQGMR